MFGSALFDDGNGMTTDAWSDRSKSRFTDVEEHSIVARTLLTSAPTVEKKKKAPAPQSQETPVQNEYADSYPNTNTTKVDWGLLAAHRVGSVLGIKLQDAQKKVTQERNLATIFFAKCNGERFKDDQRSKMLENLTLESILLAIFLPSDLSLHLQSLASQHSHLRLAARQCAAQIEQNQASLQSRGARERDLLIKRILFHADNGKTDCVYLLEPREFGNSSQWSEKTLESVREPDLFGRAIGVLVHDVLQSPSLRVKAGVVEKQSISLILSWSNALHNIKDREDQPEEIKRDDVRREISSSSSTKSTAPPPPPPLIKRAEKPVIANPLFPAEEVEKTTEFF